MPIYNGIEFLEESMNSIKLQTYKHWNVIIGVNGHPKNSDVFQYAKQFENPNIKVYDLYPIKGKCNALNKMIEYVTTDWVAILDIDDYWLPKKLEKQVEVINKNKYDVIGTHCRYFGELEKCPKIPLGILNNNIFENTNAIINSSVILKKELCYWNPEYESVEDYELWIRLAKQDKKFYNVPKVLTRHRLHPTSAFNKNDKQQELVQKIKDVYYLQPYESENNEEDNEETESL